MAEVPSTSLLPLGTLAPDFKLLDVSKEKMSRDDIREPKGLLVAFLCNHCPFVLHLARDLAVFAETCEAKGIGFVGINSNDVSRYPADSPDKMILMAHRYGWSFPYLYDETQQVARAYKAACTPDFFLFDGDLKLTYCGQFDSSRPGNGKPIIGTDLRQAVDAVLSGRPPVQPQRPSTGCSIKWKPGNEPEWFGR
jgi:peroxiredoxin